MTKPRVAFVTGAAHPTGRAIAALLLSRGYDVAIADSDVRAGCAAEDELTGTGGHVRYFHVDIHHERSIAAALDEAVATFGGLSGLVTSSADNETYNAPLPLLSLDEWDRRLRESLTAPLLSSKHAAPYLEGARGAIVHVASTRALMSERHQEAFAAAKGGLVALTHALAMSLGPLVRVNCVSPGHIVAPSTSDEHKRTQQLMLHALHPVGRAGSPDDVAEVVAFLLSDAAGFITGQNLVLDGGMVKRLSFAA